MKPTLAPTGEAERHASSDGGVTLVLPIRLHRRSGRRVISAAAEITKPPTPLQQAIARGFRWLWMLESGDAASMSDIVRRKSTDHSYVARHLNLTTLAPEIIEAILDDDLPEQTRLVAMAINPPHRWLDQFFMFQT